MVHIEVIGPAESGSWWRELAGLYLRASLGEQFAIHCWKDETQAIQQALQYGAVQPVNWAYGTVVTGTVTEKFQKFLLDSAVFQREGPDSGTQFTPFFGVFLGNAFCSSHYGRELDVEELGGSLEAEWKALLNGLAQKDWLTLYTLPTGKE